MREEYEQLELDTRDALTKAVAKVAFDSVQIAGEMIERNYRIMVSNGSLVPGFVRNRHEAYGVAAEQMVKINDAAKRIKTDVQGLLETLPDQNRSAVEATSDIYGSCTTAAAILIRAAAEMKRTMDNLYIAETTEPDPTPMERLAAGEFEEADPLDDESEDDNETEE